MLFLPSFLLLQEGIVPLGEGAAFSWCTAHQADCIRLAKVEGGDCTCLPARGTNMCTAKSFMKE